MNKSKLLLFLMSIFLMITCSFNNNVVSAFAADAETDVLDDLNLDSTFNESDYVANASDTSIEVIQIAESTTKELYIYTYQPSNGNKNLFASLISISWSIGDNLNYKIYELAFVNKNGVFNKYLVNDFVVKNDVVRYYDISTIYRPYDKDLDYDPGHDNTILNVGLAVGQLWTAATNNDFVSYYKQQNEVLTITSKFVGFIRYKKGFTLSTGFYYSPNTDAHYIAFSTDYKIDSLQEAELYYVTMSGMRNVSGFVDSGDIYDDPVEHNGVVIKASEVVESSNKLFAAKYKWNRIQTKDEFLKSDGDNLNDDTKDAISNKQFVLRFLETHYSNTSGDGYSLTTWTKVSDVTILRLKFLFDGVSYNLGVVDSQQTGSDKPSGQAGFDYENLLQDLLDLLQILLGAIVLILVVVFLWPFIAPVVTIVVKTILNAILYVIKLPFRLIKSIFRKNKK